MPRSRTRRRTSTGCRSRLRVHVLKLSPATSVPETCNEEELHPWPLTSPGSLCHLVRAYVVHCLARQFIPGCVKLAFVVVHARTFFCTMPIATRDRGSHCTNLPFPSRPSLAPQKRGPAHTRGFSQDPFSKQLVTCSQKSINLRHFAWN